MTDPGSDDHLVVVWEGARDALGREPRLVELLDRVGPVTMDQPGEPFPSLVRAIVFQQLAGAAAGTIHGRVREALEGRVTPEEVLGCPEEALRSAGLSAGKLKAIRSLAGKVADGTLDLETLEEQPDAEVEARLSEVWGIGPWTARMFLMFHLRRPDVWPVGDLGVRAGWARIHGLEKPPAARELAPAADAYRPWRSALAWYCWRAVDVLPPGGTSPD